MQTTVIWLSLFVLFLVIEIITMGLTTIWFAGGALVAFLVAVLGLGLGVQIIIFAIVSLALLAVTRPLAMKYFNQERQKTGAELLIGQKALVIEEIDTLSSKGRVEVHGQEWAAKTDAPEGKIKKSDVTVAKNYLSQDEMKQLNRMVTAYLDFAENMTLRHIPLTMQDWEKRLNSFIEMFDYGILQDAGKVSAEIAKLHAETEFEKYRVIQDRLFMSDFDKYMLELEENAKK